MEENRFFKFVWRFNGIALMLLIVLAVGVLLHSLFGIFGFNTGDRSSREIVTMQPDLEQQEHWQFGSLIDIEGSSFVMLPLETGDRYSESSYKGSPTTAWNFVFINSRNNASHWLFANNQNLVLSSDLLVKDVYSAENSVVRAILYQIVTTDSDGDGELTNLDLQSAGLSLPDGTGYREILQDIDFVIGHRLVDKDNLLLVYVRNSSAHSALVSLHGFVIVSEQEITLVRKDGE